MGITNAVSTVLESENEVEGGSYSSPLYRMKQVLLGPALKNDRLREQRLSKRVALAVFSSDPISSTAYATEEILLVLVAMGVATTWSLPIAFAIAGLLLLLVISYRQVIEAYPAAGGAYVVSRDNFGTVVSAVAGSSLLIDYILTVAVSVSSGVAALISVVPDIAKVRVEICVALVLLLAWGNLRGIREAGRIFAIPTYVYVVSVALMIVVGVVRIATGHLGHVQYTSSQSLGLEHAGSLASGVSLLILLRAFASGTTALTGVEAISNGVSAFRPPEAKNAKRTLLVMACIMGSLFLCITFLAQRFQVIPFTSGYPTVLSQIAKHAFGGGIGEVFYLIVQGATLLILVLAANTSFSGFPLLASFAAEDALLPKQLRKRGHRLVYSNGILTLALVAIVLIVGFRAQVHSLIPLYAIGVVIGFALAQAGMVSRHLRMREVGWHYGTFINGLGAIVTTIVLGVLIWSKFLEGAWMVCLAIPVMTWALLRTQRTYDEESSQLRVEVFQTLTDIKSRREVAVLVEKVDQATLAALQYARELKPDKLIAVHVSIDPDATAEMESLWVTCHINFPLEIVDAPDRNLLGVIEETVVHLVKADTDLTILIPKRVYKRWWSRLIHDQTSAGIFQALEGMENVHQAIVPFRLQK